MQAVLPGIFCSQCFDPNVRDYLRFLTTEALIDHLRGFHCPRLTSQETQTEEPLNVSSVGLVSDSVVIQSRVASTQADIQLEALGLGIIGVTSTGALLDLFDFEPLSDEMAVPIFDRYADNTAEDVDEDGEQGEDVENEDENDVENDEEGEYEDENDVENGEEGEYEDEDDVDDAELNVKS